MTLSQPKLFQQYGDDQVHKSPEQQETKESSPSYTELSQEGSPRLRVTYPPGQHKGAVVFVVEVQKPMC